MRVDPEHGRRGRCGGGHGSAADTGTAAKINDGAAARRDAELRNNVPQEQKVDRPVIQRKGRALAGAIKRLVIG